MFRALRLVKGKGEAHDAQSSEESAQLAREGLEIERALLAMDAVLDGQVDAAERLTSRDQQLFTKLATGVLRFIEATVSFEGDAIHRAVEALAASEHAAAQMKQRAQASGLRSSSFRPGAEYELAEYESGLLGAISMLLTEGKFEILKALYKIRKTYLSLEELRRHIKQVEAAGLGPHRSTLSRTSTSTSSVRTTSGGGVSTSASSVSAVTAGASDAAAAKQGGAASGGGGAGAGGGSLAEFRKTHIERTRRLNDPAQAHVTPAETVEEYLLSGVDAMSGLLHLILSSVPPNIARLLSVVGLHGEREAALEMLWHAASTFQNIHGSLAFLALMMFFDGQLQYQDIRLPREEEDRISDKYAADAVTTATGSSARQRDQHRAKTTAKLTPRELHETKERLARALHQQRLFYPHGVLWLLQEGRLVTHDDLPRGVAILESDECGPNQMRQVEGLLMFDRTMFLLSLDRLDEASKAFIDLMAVSTWSHPLYMYLAAACHLELYRMDPQAPAAAEHKRKAEEFFLKAPAVEGKKKVLGKKMPFDGFVVRKVDMFKANAKRHNLPLVDAITTSPLYEALYFWNGPGRMTPELIAQVVKRLHYSAGTSTCKESRDDAFTRQLLEAVYMRHQDPELGYKLIQGLTSKVVSGDIEGVANKKVTYHQQGEPWAGPACLYECAVYEWVRGHARSAKYVRRLLSLSADWGDDYELSTRINMKITGARDRLDIYRL